MEKFPWPFLRTLLEVEGGARGVEGGEPALGVAPLLTLVPGEARLGAMGEELSRADYRTPRLRRSMSVGGFTGFR